MAQAERASAWVRRWSHLVPAAGRVLDVACGGGRHLAWFAGLGCLVTGVDRDAAAVATLAGIAEVLVADIEAGPWPLAGREFDAVVVTNYLWRPLFATLVASLAPGGVLIYETFAQGQQTLGKPSNPNFLLRPGELLHAFAGLRIVAYEDGFEPMRHGAPPRFVQRIAAVKGGLAGATEPLRHGLLPEPHGGQVKSTDSEEPA